MALSIVLTAMFMALFGAPVTTTANSIPDLVNFLTDLQKIYQPFQIVAYMCLSYSDSIEFAETIPFQFHYTSFENVDSGTFPTDGLPHFTTFLIDLKCRGAFEMLESPEMNMFYQQPYRWILLAKSHHHVPEIEALSDSNILVVDDYYELWNFYRIRPSLPYIYEYFGYWSSHGLKINHTTLILSRRRQNLQRNALQATIVITHNQSINHLEDYQEKHIDSLCKVNFVVTKMLVESLNATLIYNHVNTWGYQDPKTGNWSGMIAELTSGRSDLGGTSLFFQPSRIKIIEYLSMITPTRSRFIFRAPPLSTTANIYSLPFTSLVWITASSLVLVAIVVIFVIVKIQGYSTDAEGNGTPTPRFTDSIMMGISAISQMGLILQPRSFSLRIVAIFLLISLLFLYTSYTANIVALLQSTTKTITTLSDLLHSNLEVGIEDTPYTRYYFPAATESTRRRIYETKVLGAKGNAFLNTSAGIERVRVGSFAFHVELSVGYELIERTFYEHEKCNLQTIEFLQVIDPWYAIQKNSSFKEMLKVNLFRIREHGLQARENAKIYTKQPICTALGQNFASVRLQECYGAFIILASGFGVAVALLVMEKFWSNARICLI